MRHAYRRDLPPWEQDPPRPRRRPLRDFLAGPETLRARRRFPIALLCAIGALGVQQATAAVALNASQAVPAAQVSPTSVLTHAAQTVPPTVTVPPAPTTTVPPAPTTTVPPTTLPPVTAPPATAAPRLTAAPAPPSDYGCGPAVAYLSAHSAPGFRFECPGYSLGHQAMTCIDVPGVCAGEKLIVITVPCKAAYMNEASNSWSLQGLSNAPIDPYGYCH